MIWLPRCRSLLISRRRSSLLRSAFTASVAALVKVRTMPPPRQKPMLQALRPSAGSAPVRNFLILNMDSLLPMKERVSNGKVEVGLAPSLEGVPRPLPLPFSPANRPNVSFFESAPPLATPALFFVLVPGALKLTTVEVLGCCLRLPVELAGELGGARAAPPTPPTLLVRPSALPKEGLRPRLAPAAALLMLTPEEEEELL
mmetsp:Transcript_4725/g.7963  ORF Transcript_4725/g.7963 Transcript_4725/m.7963 type:complete len:201 (-) Transcript_4725:706-1308(-)